MSNHIRMKKLLDFLLQILCVWSNGDAENRFEKGYKAGLGCGAFGWGNVRSLVLRTSAVFQESGLQWTKPALLVKKRFFQHPPMGKSKFAIPDEPTFAGIEGAQSVGK